jgi:hypothetical protein
VRADWWASASTLHVRADSRTRYALPRAGYLRDIRGLSDRLTSPSPWHHSADLQVLTRSPNGVRTRVSTLRG